MNVKRLMAVACALGSAMFMTACGGSDKTEEPTSTSTPGTTETAIEPFELTVAFSASLPQVEKLPMIMAAEALNDQGHDVEIIYLQSDEDAVQAAARGEADLAQTAAASMFASVSNGAPVTGVMGVYGASYVAVVPADVSSPEGLDGLRLGVHAQVSSTTLYARVMLQDYPDVEPQFVVVPGSANRIQALAVGELDASIIQLTEVGDLEELAPGKFHAIYSFAEEHPELVGAVLIAGNQTLAQRSDEIKVFMAEVLHQQDLFYDDLDTLAEAIVKHIPDATPELAAELAELYTSNEVWPRDGGLTEDAVTSTGTVLQESQLLEGTVPSFDDCCTRELLDGLG